MVMIDHVAAQRSFNGGLVGGAVVIVSSGDE